MTGQKFLPLENLALRTIRRFGMLEPGDGVVAAVSGGADSVALLLCLQRLAPRFKLALSAAHLNHRLRGAESDADEQFVRELCARLGIDLAIESADVGKAAAAARQNLEETARRARYEFLRRVARQAGARRIAVGHTLNDQAETVLFRLLRGSGAAGLAAIHPVVDGTIIRPLLETSRAEVRRYLEALEISCREDSTNRDLSLRRNRLRHEWIPELEKQFNPRLARTLAREAELARETSDFLASICDDAYGRIKKAAAGGVLLPAAEVAKMHPLLQKLVLRRALRDVCGTLRGICACHTDSLISLCRSGRGGRRVELPSGCAAIRRFDCIAVLKDLPGAVQPFEYDLSIPGGCEVLEAGIEVTATVTGPGSLTRPREACSSAMLDGDSLYGRVSVRSRRPGDRYGGPGHRKVKKMLIDAKIDRQSRAALPVVAAGNAVIWIPGFKPAKRFAAHPGSSRCILLEARPLSGTSTSG